MGWVVNLMPWPLYPKGNGPQYTLNRRMVGTYSQSGDLVNKEYFCPTQKLNPILYCTLPIHYTDYDILAPQ